VVKERQHAPAEFPEYAPMVKSLVCPECGEQFMETKAAVRGEDTLCISCARDDCLAVLGGGIRVLKAGAF